MGVAVVGMDRSGSSLAMRMLSALGVDIGDAAEHIDPHPEDNPHGYQELKELVDLDGRLLDLIEADPLDVELCRGVDWANRRFEELRTSANDLVRSSFEAEPWAIKNPRMTLAIPFWRHVFPDLKFVICLRDPASVIRSQERRESNYEDRERLLRKWLRYTVASFEATEGAERLVVIYDEAVERPRETAQAYVRFLGLTEPSDERFSEVGQLIDPELVARQSKSAEQSEIALPAEINAAYLLLKAAANDAAQLESAAAAAADLEHALIERMGAKWKLAATVGTYEQSLSWRLTSPLRSIAARFRRD